MGLLGEIRSTAWRIPVASMASLTLSVSDIGLLVADAPPPGNAQRSGAVQASPHPRRPVTDREGSSMLPRPMALTWSLAVPTLNREDILVRSLLANVRQTRLPSQVVVVDSSDGWQRTRERVLAEVAPQLPGAEWIYIGSDVKGLTRQRNLGLARCTGDVVFFLDDDSFMYRDCAEHVMQVYEADAEGRIGGVCASLADRLEGAPVAAQKPVEDRSGLPGRGLQLAHRQWR